MHVSAELGDASRFSEYDKDSNIYRVNGLLTSKEDVGRYLIRIDAVLFNKTYSDEF